MLQVLDMRMFSGATYLIKISGLGTYVTDMSEMFYGATSFNHILGVDVSK